MCNLNSTHICIRLSIMKLNQKKKKKSLIACDETSRMYKRVTMEPRNAMLELRIDK